MKKQLLSTFLTASTLVSIGQMAASGDGFALDFSNASSTCYASTAPNTNGRFADGNSLEVEDHLKSSGELKFTARNIDLWGSENVTWYGLPTNDGTCSNLTEAEALDMSSNSKVTIVAEASETGAELKFYIGEEKSMWSTNPKTSTHNIDWAGEIPAHHTFSAANTEETFTFDFSTLDTDKWTGWAGKDKIASYGFVSISKEVTFKIKSISFGASSGGTSSGGGSGTGTGTGTGSGTGSGSGSGTGSGVACTGVNNTGKATWYDNLENKSNPLYTGLVRCSFQEADIAGTDYGALDIGLLQEDDDAKYCGMCVEATGPAGTALIQIVDECPDCWDRGASGEKLVGTNTKFGDIDLSPSAFPKVIGPESVGIGDFSWQEVSCPWTTPLHVIVEGSNQWYAKVIIGNHVNRIAKVEVQQGGAWFEMTRGSDNGWVSSGVIINEVSKSFRITDVYGEEVIVSGIDFSADPTDSKTVGTSNFPACGGTSSTSRVNSLDYVIAFPNPANDFITFDGVDDVEQMTIYNVNGQAVAQKVFTNSMNQVGLDISSFAPGIYVATMIGGNNSGKVTFIKK